MAKRRVIKINYEKCNGCALCIPNCPEGAIQIIDGKARLISDLFCDGLGACLGHCPQGAISIVEREAAEYNEIKVMANIIKQGSNVIKAHLLHLKEHNQIEYLKQALDYLKEEGIENPLEELQGVQESRHAGFFACPGSKLMDFRRLDNRQGSKEKRILSKGESKLRTWPVQIMLVASSAPYFDNADLLIAADCVPFAYANFHEDLLNGRILLIGCPKLDDIKLYQEKIGQIIMHNNIKSVTYAHMEVPGCFGLVGVIKAAINQSGKDIPFKEVVISTQGERLP